MGELVDQCSISQKIAGFLSMILSTIVTILGFWWGSHGNNNQSGWLGGFNKCSLHAVLMILGMCFCYTQALMSFRVFHFLGHGFTKGLHAIWNSLTIACVITALYYIIKWHNAQNFGHLTTMHSWLGLILIIVYLQNWVLGIINFGLGDLIPLEWKKQYLPSHRFLGIVGLLLAAAVMQTGIAQKSWLDGTFGCMYIITDNGEKNNPTLGYDDIGAGCRVGLGIGILIILNTMIALFALWHFPPEIKIPDHPSEKQNPVGSQSGFEIVSRDAV